MERCNFAVDKCPVGHCLLKVDGLCDLRMVDCDPSRAVVGGNVTTMRFRTLSNNSRRTSPATGRTSS
jgi:hypothetical protein